MINKTANYWKNAPTNVKAAVEWTKKMSELYSDEIASCVEKTVRWNEGEIQLIGNTSVIAPSEIVVELIDSVSAVMKYSGSSDKVCVLNFASFTEPGGAYLRGSSAQEESLCGSSILYNVLSNTKFTLGYYYDNNRAKNRGLYLDRALYTPDVLFLKDNEKVKCDVITCAAPNYNAARTYCHVSKEENSEVLARRIEYVLDIMDYNDVDIPILGAYGSGVFGQDPAEVASIFWKKLHAKEYSFKKVIFAVIPQKTADIFEEVFKENRNLAKASQATDFKSLISGLDVDEVYSYLSDVQKDHVYRKVLADYACEDTYEYIRDTYPEWLKKYPDNFITNICREVGDIFAMNGEVDSSLTRKQNLDIIIQRVMLDTPIAV